jgi:hypothetical protein
VTVRIYSNIVKECVIAEIAYKGAIGAGVAFQRIKGYNIIHGPIVVNFSIDYRVAIGTFVVFGEPAVISII